MRKTNTERINLDIIKRNTNSNSFALEPSKLGNEDITKAISKVHRAQSVALTPKAYMNDSKLSEKGSVQTKRSRK